MSQKSFLIPYHSILGHLLTIYDVPLSGKVVNPTLHPYAIKQTRNLLAGDLGGFIDLSFLTEGRMADAISLFYAHDHLTPGQKADAFTNTMAPIIHFHFQHLGHQMTLSKRVDASCTYVRATPTGVFNLVFSLSFANDSDPTKESLFSQCPLPYEDREKHPDNVTFHVRVFPVDHPAYDQFPRGILYFPKHYVFNRRIPFLSFPSLSL